MTAPTDDELLDMSADDRADLARRLARIHTANIPLLARNPRARHRFLALMTVSSLLLIPWVVFLAFTLPHRYIADHWTATWVGFDVVLMGMLARTAWLAWRGRQALVLAAFTTATLLVCDAYFDVLTASSTMDLTTSIAAAVLIEIPLAVFLYRGALRVLRASVRSAHAAITGHDLPQRSVSKLPLLLADPAPVPQRARQLS